MYKVGTPFTSFFTFLYMLTSNEDLLITGGLNKKERRTPFPRLKDDST